MKIRTFRSFIFTLAVALVADTTPQTLPFSQNWSNTGLITTNDNWDGVSGIIGYRGDDLTTATGTDPQTILADGSNTPVDVNANQTNPSFTTGGVTEFEIADPTIALTGSGTADAPHIVIRLNTTGQSNINVAYNVRDIEAGTDNAVQQVALHYRVGGTGNYTNIPAAYIADATEGGTATKVTPISVILPAECNNQPLVELRIMTTNAVGNDEWVGIDDINITAGSGSVPPSGLGTAVPSTVTAGDTTLLTVAVTPGSSPVSTGLAVSGNLASIGGATTQSFFDDGSNGDVTAGDGTFSYLATVTSGTTAGAKTIPFTVSDAQSRSSSGSISLTVTIPTTTLTISQIQGTGDRSTFDTQAVKTNGVVTAVKSNGFFIQDPTGDGDPATSDGIFVFTSSTPPAAAVVGNRVEVVGVVSEFSPSTDLASPPITEIVSPVVSILSTGNPLPAPVTLTAATMTPFGGISQLERYEGMRVEVATVTAISPTDGNVSEANATSTSNGVFYAVIPPNVRPFREPGIEVPNSLSCTPGTIPCFDANPERLRVDSDAQVGTLAINLTTGATVTGLRGVLDYGFRSYTIDPDPGIAIGVTGSISAIPVPAPLATELTVAHFNLERFYDTVNDPATSDVVLTAAAFDRRLAKASLAIRNVLLTPDVLAVVEMENLTTLQALAGRIDSDAATAGQVAPNYQAFLFEGNDIGGIDVGFLVKTPKVSTVDVTQVGKMETYINPNNGSPELLNDRPSVVLRGIATAPGSDSGLPFTVVVNHLRSLLGMDDPIDGNRVRTKRKAQAESLATLLQGRQSENVISVGDYNAFEFNDGYVDVMGTIKGSPAPANEVMLATSDLVDPNLTNLIETLPASARYSYSFDGNAQVLDHALVNQKLFPRVSRFAIAHNDADFPEVYRNDATRPERISDHDAPVTYFKLPIEVTSRIAVTRGVVTYNPAANIYTEAIRVKNIGGSAIAAPLHLEFSGLVAGVTVLGATTVNGNPLLTLKSGVALQPNATIVVLVQYQKPSATPVSFVPRTYSVNY